MKKLTVSVLGILSVATLALTGAGCSQALAETPGGKDKPTGQGPYDKAVEDFIQNDSTYKFDGMDDVKVVKVVEVGGKWEYTVEYRTRHPGHGDRSGQMLAQVITPHTAVVEVKGGKVTSAVCDGKWNIAEMGEEFVLPVGQSVTITGEDLVIKFDGVTSDSRSPKGVETIWAGEARIRLVITYHGTTEDVTLTEKGGSEGYTQDKFDQYQLSFQLKPYPEAGKQPAAGDYSLIMQVIKGNDPAGVPIIDNRSIVRGVVTAVARAESGDGWEVEVLVKSVENAGTLPNLVPANVGEKISVRTTQNAAPEVGQAITVNVQVSGDEKGTFLTGSQIDGSASENANK